MIIYIVHGYAFNSEKGCPITQEAVIHSFLPMRLG